MDTSESGSYTFANDTMTMLFSNLINIKNKHKFKIVISSLLVESFYCKIFVQTKYF